MEKFLKGISFFTIVTLKSLSTYKVNLAVFFASAWIGALSYFFNANFRDVVISEYGVNYTSFAVAGAVATCFLSVTSVVLTPQDLTLFGFWERVVGGVAADFTLGIAKALPVLALASGMLKPTVWLALTVPMAFLLFVVVSALLTVSDTLTFYENPVRWAFFGFWNLLGGVWFPVEALPSYLKYLAYLLPQYHMVALMRDPLIGKLPLFSMAYAILFTSISLPAVKWGMRKTFETGSLVVRS